MLIKPLKVRQILRKYSVFLLSFLILIPFFPNTALAATFSPKFEFIISNPTLGANSDIILIMNQETAGEIGFKRITVTVPAGFRFTPSTDLGQDEQVATGSLIAGLQPDGTATINTGVSLLNDQTIIAGETVHWKLILNDLPGVAAVDVLLNGNEATGYTFSAEFPAGLVVPTPIFWGLNIFGISPSSGAAIVRNPLTGGTYTWQADFLASTGGGTSTYQFGVGFPDSSTVTGSNVSTTFGSSASITFSQVTSSGTTSITSLSSPPTSGTGSFQLSGGVYYDFDTTAVISCPCTITMSYPSGTQNPRLYHLENGVWVDVTTSVDRPNTKVTGVVSSFSFFAIAEANFNVLWDKPIAELLEQHGNPFPQDVNDRLGIKFNLLDVDSNLATPANVSVEIWQIKDAVGASIDLVKVLTLTPELNETLSRFQTKLDLDDNPLGLGTYEIRVLVSNTTATQDPQTASFTVVED